MKLQRSGAKHTVSSEMGVPLSTGIIATISVSAVLGSAMFVAVIYFLCIGVCEYMRRARLLEASYRPDAEVDREAVIA